MKVNYKSHPFLAKIYQKDLGPIRYHTTDQEEFQAQKENIRASWKKRSHQFRKNIRILTEPFKDALYAAAGKLAESEDLHNNTFEAGTMFSGDFTYCYLLGEIDTPDELCFFVFHKDILLLYTDTANTDRNYIYGANKLLSANPGEANEIIAEKIISCIDSMNYVLIVLNFIKYAPVEIKHLKANTKSGGIICRYKNDTKTDVQILDSTWFTTLVKSDAFKVRGHFRLQPCGVGLKDKKLTWVKEYIKSGMTRIAKKITS